MKKRKIFLSILLSMSLMITMSSNAFAARATGTIGGAAAIATLDRYATYATASTSSSVSPATYIVTINMSYYNDASYSLLYTQSSNGDTCSVSTSVYATGSGAQTYFAESDHYIYYFSEIWNRHLLD